MRGFILKDIYTTLKNAKTLLIFVFVFACLAISSSGDMSFASGYLMIMMAILPITSFSYDAASKWDIYAVSTPVSRKKIVLSKYVFLLILLTFATVFLIAMCGIGMLIWKGNFQGEESLWSILLCGFIGMTIALILLPITFKFGPEKSRFILMALVIIPIITFSLARYYLKSIVLPDFSWILNNLYIIPIALILAAIIFFFISYNISCAIYKRKDV